MSDIKVTIDTRGFSKAISDIIQEKSKKVQDSRELQKEALEILLDYIREYLPKDTGALKYQQSGNASTSPHYFREGSIRYLQNGIEWDALEHRMKGNRHYARAMFSKVFGGPDIEHIVDYLKSTGDWDEFLRQLAVMINSYMRNG